MSGKAVHDLCFYTAFLKRIVARVSRPWTWQLQSRCDDLSTWLVLEHKTAAAPDLASVLLMSGKLDPRALTNSPRLCLGYSAHVEKRAYCIRLRDAFVAEYDIVLGWQEYLRYELTKFDRRHQW